MRVCAHAHTHKSVGSARWARHFHFFFFFFFFFKKNLHFSICHCVFWQKLFYLVSRCSCVFLFFGNLIIVGCSFFFILSFFFFFFASVCIAIELRASSLEFLTVTLFCPLVRKCLTCPMHFFSQFVPPSCAWFDELYLWNFFYLEVYLRRACVLVAHAFSQKEIGPDRLRSLIWNLWDLCGFVAAKRSHRWAFPSLVSLIVWVGCHLSLPIRKRGWCCTTFVHMRSGDHLRDSKMSKKKAPRFINFFNEPPQTRTVSQTEKRADLQKSCFRFC